MNNLNTILAISGALLGAGLSLMLIKVNKNYRQELEKTAREILEKGVQAAKTLVETTHSRAKEIKETAQEENKRMEEQMEALKKNLDFKGKILEKREQRNASISMTINQVKKEADVLSEDINKSELEMVESLKKKTGLDSESAKKVLIDKFDKQLELEKINLIQKIEENANEDSMNIAKNILRGIIQRITSPSSVDKHSTGIKIKKDRFKGLLIGKGGKNIEFFESQFKDVSVIFNLEPEMIYVGGLNLVNRNIAKNAIEKLDKSKKDFDQVGISKAIEEAKKDMDRDLLKIGEEAIKIAKVTEKVPQDLVKLVGRLKFRTSFGQNVLQHSIEMAAMAAMLASEMGANMERAKIAAFFHDIGKAIDHEVGGSHDQLTKEILEKFNFDPEIVHAAYAHHDAEPARTPEAMLVKAADAISAGRPGARQESLTSYLDRIQKLEETAKSFEGVKKVFAISAGRELRIIVDEDRITDEQIKEMAQSAAHKIEEDLSYPGKIKVNVIRRTEAIDYAK
ncbi:MAG: Rnase Y domain-containing protein [Candidatus Gracilibacteria bacterium]